MIGRLARNREHRVKQAIFRGVLEDNLQLLGRTTPRAHVRRRLPRAAKYALSAATLAGVTLFTGSSLSPVIFPEQQIQARFIAGASSGMTIVALTPSRRHTNASACAW